MKVTMDASQLRTLAADLTKAGKVPQDKLVPIMSKAALNIKKQLRTEMAASRHFSQITKFISYDLVDGGDTVEAEIGPEATGAGYLENIAYFGTARGGGTVPDPQGALDKEAPNLEKYLLQLADGLL